MSIRYYQLPCDSVQLILSRHCSLSFPPHTHASNTILGLVLEGTITLTLKDKLHTLPPKSFFAIPPSTLHCIQASAPYSLLCLCIKNAHTQSLPLKVTALLNAACQNGDISLAQLKTSKKEFLTKAANCTAPMQENKDTLSALAKTFTENPEISVSCNAMSVFTSYSKYHLIRKFKAKVGLTPHTFQLQNRIRMAQRLLQTAQPLAEIALLTGFSDQSHFNRTFKKWVGVSPALYKTSIIKVPFPFAS